MNEPPSGLTCPSWPTECYLTRPLKGGHGIGRKQEAASQHPWVEPVRPRLPEGQNHQGKQ